MFYLCTFLRKKKEKNYTTKYRYKGIQHFGLLQETFKKSFAAGLHVVYSTMLISPQRSNEATGVGKELASCDDYPDGIWYTHVISNVTGVGSGL